PRQLSFLLACPENLASALAGTGLLVLRLGQLGLLLNPFSFFRPDRSRAGEPLPACLRLASVVPFDAALRDVLLESLQVFRKGLAGTRKVLLRHVAPLPGSLDAVALLAQLLRSRSHLQQVQLGPALAESGLALGQAALQVGHLQAGDHCPRRNTV